MGERLGFSDGMRRNQWGPIAFDTDHDGAATGKWPAGAGIRSAGIDTTLLVSGAGAWLIDLATEVRTPVEHLVDMKSRSFLARLPRSVVEPTRTWTVRLAAGLANAASDYDEFHQLICPSVLERRARQDLTYIPRGGAEL